MLHFKVMIVLLIRKILLIRNFTEEIFGILVFFFTAHQMRIVYSSTVCKIIRKTLKCNPYKITHIQQMLEGYAGACLNVSLMLLAGIEIDRS